MKQFGRVIQLNIGNATESVIYNNLRITFDVNKTIDAEPNVADITLYNLNQTNRNLITSKHYNHVELYVNYREDDLRMIFKGDIITVTNTQSELDIVTKLKCSDGYRAYTEKTIIKTLSAGHSDDDIVTESLLSFGVQKGHVDLPNNKTLPRGRVYMCDTREAVSKVAKNNNANWSIQDNQLVIIPKNKAIRNDEGYVISSSTGMIGSPQKTNQGLEVTTLCNPHYKIGAFVRIQSKTEEYNGDYKIQSIKHSGDLLGDGWKSKLVCYGGNFTILK